MPDDLFVRNVFGWEHFHVYLAGAIDFTRGDAGDWRDEWTERLLEIGIAREQVFNPCRKPLPKNAPFNLDDEGALCHELREADEYDELCEKVSQIAHTDLRLVDKSDIVLVNMPRVGRAQSQDAVKAFYNGVKQLESLERHYTESAWKVADTALEKMILSFHDVLGSMERLPNPTFGTIHEIVVARQQRKPVYMVWEGGKKECSGWLMWLVGHENIFSTFEELLTRLRMISEGKVEYNAKDWLLLDLGKK